MDQVDTINVLIVNKIDDESLRIRHQGVANNVMNFIKIGSNERTGSRSCHTNIQSYAKYIEDFLYQRIGRHKKYRWLIISLGNKFGP